MEIIRENTLNQTCFACPSQWEAKTIDNKDVFIRVRHGFLRLEVDNETIFSGNPDGVDGVMSTSDMIKYINETTSKVRII